MYVQLDVDWPENRKRIRAGLEGAGLHAICLCLAKRSPKDGWVARDTLALYGATDELVDRLIDLDMLDANGEWVRPHDWLEVNLSSDRIRAEKTDKARAANHARWQHPGAYESCEKCHKPRSSEADPDGVRAESQRIPGDPSTGSEPEPEQQPQATDADGRRAVLEAAAAIIGERAGARPTAQNPARVAAAVANGVIKDRYEDAYRFLAEDPTLSPDDLAELLEPPAEDPRRHIPDGRPELPNVRDLIDFGPRPDPEETRAALDALRAEHPRLAKANGTSA